MSLSSTAKTALRAALCSEGALKEIANVIDGIVGGSGAVSGVSSVTFSTGLSAVFGLSVIQVIGTAPTTTVITCTISGGDVTLFFWRATAAGDTTLIASTANVSYRWIATGTP